VPVEPQFSTLRTVAKAGTEKTTTTVVGRVVKKKQWTRKTTGPYNLLEKEEEEEERFDQEASPSKKFKRIQTESRNCLIPDLIRTLRQLKDHSHQPGEPVAPWLFRCRDNEANSQPLQGKQAQHPGSLARNWGIERGLGKEAAICSLWRWLL